MLALRILRMLLNQYRLIKVFAFNSYMSGSNKIVPRNLELGYLIIRFYGWPQTLETRTPQNGSSCSQPRLMIIKPWVCLKTWKLRASDPSKWLPLVLVWLNNYESLGLY